MRIDYSNASITIGGVTFPATHLSYSWIGGGNVARTGWRYPGDGNRATRRKSAAMRRRAMRHKVT